jgi:hypothetical protein
LRIVEPYKLWCKKSYLVAKGTGAILKRSENHDELLVTERSVKIRSGRKM